MSSKQFVTQGIVLSRTNYGEADRIITFLTPNHGKVRAIAKAVRKSQSKLAGGIELFSVSDLTLVIGRGEINTLISSRLARHYGGIVKDTGRTKLAYDFLKAIGRATEDEPEEAYFTLLDKGLAAIDDFEMQPDLVALWFNMQLLKLAGHMPNLRTDSSGARLANAKSYTINMDEMRFEPETSGSGSFNANHIKFLRLGFSAAKPQIIHKINGVDKIAPICQPLVQTMLRSYIRV